VSAYVTYDIQPFSPDGERLPAFSVRAVCKPSLDEALMLCRQRRYAPGLAVEITRSVPARIATPGLTQRVTRRVSASITLGK
jgi:hypothetical protein